MMNDQLEQRNQLQNKLIEKALKDDSFRKALVTSPKETLEAEYKMKIPEHFKIQVLEEDANTIYLVLPSQAHFEKSEELSEAELQQVAGGTDEDYSATCFDW